MAKDGETHGQPPHEAKPKRFWLEHAGQNIELRRGRLLVGRSSGCQLVLEDSMVSRRHAELLVTEDTVTVVDLGSVNGVYLNARRVRESVRMREGDRLQIGQREFVLQSMARSSVQSGVLITVQREAATGKDLSASVSDRAAIYAVRIASATGRASWLDYTIDLYAKLGRVLPSAVVDQLYDVVRKARGMNVNALRAYVALLETKELGPSERFVLQRLQGLERVVLS